MYNIERLYDLLAQLKRQHSNTKLVSELECTLNDLSVGVSIPSEKREKIYNLMERLQHSSNGELKDSSRKVMAKIRRERKVEAEEFYFGHDCGNIISHVNCIDFNYDIHKGRIEQGKSLYQWCKLIYASDGDVCLYNGKNCTIGNYFTNSIVSPHALGIARFYDLKHENGSFVATGQQVCCRFSFPFSCDCLISTAKGAADSWNVIHYSNGNIIPEENRGIWGHGGAIQLFIPLSNAQKVELAKIAEFV